MKNKNLLYLLVCLFPLLASCNTPNPSSSSTSEDENPSSTQDSLSSDSSVDNSSSADESSSTNQNEQENYFTGTDKRLLDNYFDFKLPYIDENYTITDNTEQYGVIAVSIEYYDMTTRDYMDFLSYCDDNYTFDEEYNDGTDVWQCYSINGYFIDVCYDTYSSSSPFVYLLVYQPTEKEFVNNDFVKEDKELLEDYFAFSIPTVGTSYELYDYSDAYSAVYVMLYYNYTTQEDFSYLLNSFKNIANEKGSSVYEGLTYYKYGINGQIISLAFDEVNYDYPYIIIELYDESLLENVGGNDSDVSTDEAISFINGKMNELDSKLAKFYLGFDIPTTGSSYNLFDYTSEDGYPSLGFIYYDVTQTQYDALIGQLETIFTYYFQMTDDTYGLTWDLYTSETTGFDMEITYCTNLFDVNSVIMYVYVSSYSEGANEFVNNTFIEKDKASLSVYFDFEIPTIGQYYYMYNSSKESNATVIELYYFFPTSQEYESYLETLSSTFTYENSFEYEGYTYHYYSKNEFIIQVAYDNTDSSSPYVCIYIYDSILEQA